MREASDRRDELQAAEEVVVESVPSVEGVPPKEGGGKRLTESAQQKWPFLTADLPGIGGRLKTVPEDFLVEEISAFEPCGEGEHLYLRLEKRNLSHEQLLRHVSRTLGVSRNAIGTAGMKDRQALTRQWISVPCPPGELPLSLSRLETESVRLLTAKRHRHKLKTGKLKGNRFVVLVRDAVGCAERPATSNINRDISDSEMPPSAERGDSADTVRFATSALQRAERIAERLMKDGFPNYFGQQRFGYRGETRQTGLQLLRREIRPDDLPAGRRRFLLRLSLSAVQSWLFNRALASRLTDGLFSTVLRGDILQVVASGGLFVAENVCREQSRLAKGETVLTGPLFGPKMRWPCGVPRQREEELLQEAKLGGDEWAAYRRICPGSRRPYAVRPAYLEIRPQQEGLQFEFVLPPGSYATVLLREFMKCDG